jgi:Fic family protein
LIQGKKEKGKEAAIAELLCDVYASFSDPLSEEILSKWHTALFKGTSHIADIGKYRSHVEPMQIVSTRFDAPKVFFEAPPSSKIPAMMKIFVDRFNALSPRESILGRAAALHVYFESIHPFEDGNGRIGRALVEKVLSQGIKSPILIAVSKILEKRKKEYYMELEKCNRTLEINSFVQFFASAILQAQEESMRLLQFLISKSKMLTKFSNELNSRQERVLLRMFQEGIDGFKGGLSAENYISITKTSRATATRDLSDLVEMGALVKTGELRHTRYSLNL